MTQVSLTRTKLFKQKHFLYTSKQDILTANTFSVNPNSLFNVITYVVFSY